jgi:hypothetical protein
VGKASRPEGVLRYLEGSATQPAWCLEAHPGDHAPNPTPANELVSQHGVAWNVEGLAAFEEGQLDQEGASDDFAAGLAR